MPSKTILYFILNWGLGHATRSIPIVRAMLGLRHRVVIVSTGRSLALLRREFSGCEFVDLPDYGIRYHPHRRFLVPGLLAQMPRIFLRLHREHRDTERLAARFKADRIVSDNRYGCYSVQAPSYLITHQLRFQLPRGLKWSAWISEWFNRFFFRRFRAVFVPDERGIPNLSGELSHRGTIASHRKVHFIGPLSSLDFYGKTVKRDIDVLFLISGPEPQRTAFEKLIMNQIDTVEGMKVVVLGKPEGDAEIPRQERMDLRVHPHLDRNELSDLLRRAEWVVSRSGYSTVMELASAGKKAILVPTPGQTEQEYLAEHLKEAGMFFSVSQENFNAKDALIHAERFYTHPFSDMKFNQVDLILSLVDFDHPHVRRNFPGVLNRLTTTKKLQ